MKTARMSAFERWAGLLGLVFALLLLAGFWYALSGGEDLEARDNRGRTPLIIAAEQGDVARVDDLLARGVQLEALDDCGWSAMMRAAASGHTAIVQTMLDRGAAIDRRDKVGYTSRAGGGDQQSSSGAGPAARARCQSRRAGKRYRQQRADVGYA